MGALTVLYLVLPFALAFIIHDAEEVAVQHKWMLKHKDSLIERVPKMKAMIEHLLQLSTKAFAIAAAEELVVILLATAYLLYGGPLSVELWSALFMAFSIHLLVHIGQAVAVRGYVPGLITSVLLLPYAFMGLHMIWNYMSGIEMILWGAVGIAVMVANLRFAHWIGIKCSQ